MYKQAELIITKCITFQLNDFGQYKTASLLLIQSKDLIVEIKRYQ